MDYIYMIEKKSFFKDAQGIDYQVADLGTLPMPYKNFKKAVMAMQGMRNRYINLFGETMVKEYTAEDITEAYLYDRFETLNPTTGTRTIVSLYKTYFF